MVARTQIGHALPTNPPRLRAKALDHASGLIDRTASSRSSRGAGWWGSKPMRQATSMLIISTRVDVPRMRPRPTPPHSLSAMWLAALVSLVAPGCGGNTSMSIDGGRNDLDAAAADARGADDSGADAAGCGPCDDAIACTDDSCGTSGACVHRPNHATCGGTMYCDATSGCAGAAVCGDASDCHAPDACVIASCDTTSATCRFASRDADADGDPPLACGGGDCNDADPAVSSAAIEVCDGVDQDCDGMVDESDQPLCQQNTQADLVGYSCTDGMCGCALTVCRNDAAGIWYCTDMISDPFNCGRCAHPCPSGYACAGGVCTAM